MKRPWMPLNIGEFLQDTAHLSPAEIGAYMLLIMHYWARGGPCPNEDAFRRVTRMTNRQWSQSGDVLRAFFRDDLSHGRLDRDLAHVIEKSETNSANAKGRQTKRTKIADDPHPDPQTDLIPKKVSDVVGPRVREETEPVSDERLAKQAAVALGLAFLNAAGFKDHSEAPMNWYGVTDRAAIWIERGWSEAMIVAETKIVATRAGTPMPVAYYEKVFTTAAARAAQPLPTAVIKPSETVNVSQPRTNRPSLGSALDASIAAARSASETGDRASSFGERETAPRLLSHG